jgi:AraC-like DNA-binding protein
MANLSAERYHRTNCISQQPDQRATVSTHSTAARCAPGPYVAVLIADAEDRRLILDAVSPISRVRVFQAFQDVQESIRKECLTGLICECRDAYGYTLVTFAEGQDVHSLPTLVFLRPVECEVISFTKLAQTGWPAIARVAGQTGLGDAARAVVEDHWPPEASAPIMRELVARSPSQLDMLLVIAMIAGSRRLGVAEFAWLARVSERTLQRRLAIAGLPCARRLLAWAMILHSAWRLEVIGQRVKEAGVSAGFLTREAFTSFVRRHSGFTLSRLCQDGSFRENMETFLSELYYRPVGDDWRVSKQTGGSCT